MSDKKSILVTGATGQQGGAVAQELLAKQGYQVIVMTSFRHGSSLVLTRASS